MNDLPLSTPTSALSTAPRSSSTVLTAVDVSVVICCYTERRWDDIVAAVESVRRQTLPPCEVMVVVDHNPSLLERVRRELPDVTAVPNAHGKGLSGGRSTGVEESSGGVVVFLDDDAVAAPDWLEHFARAYQDPDVMAVGGRTDPAWVVERPAWFPREFDWVVGCSYEGLPRECTPVRNVFGGNMSFRREVLVEIGGFRGELGRARKRPLGCEETELCIRAHVRYPGRTILYQPRAVIRHKVPPERGTFAYFRSRCYAEGLSKAVVARLAGQRQALSTERSYVRTVLARGVAAGLRDAFTRRVRGGLGRAAAIVAGLLVTAVGYAVGRASALLTSVRTALVVAPAEGLRAAPAQVVGARRALARAAPSLLPAAAALIAWLVSLRGVDLHAMNDLGLVSVLPVTYWLALGLLVATFPVLVHRGRAPGPVLAVHILVLLLVLHATPTLLYGTLRYSWAWKHIGIVDYIMRHGTVDPWAHDPGASYLNVYHAWPGFFALNAFLTQAGGLRSALSYAAWGPPFFEAMLLGPLVTIFRAFTADRRLVWLAVLLFYLGNWVGQDYFSPQAFSFFLYLTILAICLRWLRPTHRTHLPRTRLGRRLTRGAPLLREPTTTAGRAGLVAIVLACMTVIASSHQLTPFMLIVALAVLVLARRTGPRWLPWAMTAITLAWILTIGSEFVRANLYWIVPSVGRPLSNTELNFANLSKGPDDQLIVHYLDQFLSGLLWLLAVAGFARRRRHGRRDVVPVLLALAALVIVVANSYGGEVLFRAYMFALPFVALFAAALFYPTADPAVAPGRSPKAGLSTLLPSLLAIVLTGAFVFAYYGKERMNYFSHQEVAASRWLYATAPPGSLFTAVTNNYPWALTRYEDYTYTSLWNLTREERLRLTSDPVPTLVRLMSGDYTHAYLIVNLTNRLDMLYLGGLPPGALPRITAALQRSPRFRVVFRNRDATIYELVPAPPGGRTTVDARSGQAPTLYRRPPLYASPRHESRAPSDRR